MDRPKEDHAGHLAQEAGSGIGRASSIRLAVAGSYDGSPLDGGCSHGEVAHHDGRRSIQHPQEDSHWCSHDGVESASVGPYIRHR